MLNLMMRLILMEVKVAHIGKGFYFEWFKVLIDTLHYRVSLVSLRHLVRENPLGR